MSLWIGAARANARLLPTEGPLEFTNGFPTDEDLFPSVIRAFFGTALLSSLVHMFHRRSENLSRPSCDPRERPLQAVSAQSAATTDSGKPAAVAR